MYKSSQMSFPIVIEVTVCCLPNFCIVPFFSDSTSEAPLLLQNLIACSSSHSVLLQRILMI